MCTLHWSSCSLFSGGGLLSEGGLSGHHVEYPMEFPRNSMEFHGNSTEYSIWNSMVSPLKILHVFFPRNSMEYKNQDRYSAGSPNSYLYRLLISVSDRCMTHLARLARHVVHDPRSHRALLAVLAARVDRLIPVDLQTPVWTENSHRKQPESSDCLAGIVAVVLVVTLLFRPL